MCDFNVLDSFLNSAIANKMDGALFLPYSGNKTDRLYKKISNDAEPDAAV